MNTYIHATWPAPWRRFGLVVLAMATITVVSGCSLWGPERVEADNVKRELIVPEEDGMYAYAEDELVRLDGDADWEKETWENRSRLSPDSELIIRHPLLTSLAGAAEDEVGLRKVAWVRSEVTENGHVAPVSGSQWKSVALPAFEVAADYARSKEREDLVHLHPQQPLEPGLYSLYVRTDEGPLTARFGVAWPETDKQAYAALVCVDRYTGKRVEYRPCSAQDKAGTSEGLKIHLVKPETLSTDAGRSMIVSGVIVNVSDNARQLPPLAGELRSANGEVLGKWRFRADADHIEPGQSASFRSQINNAPAQTHSVHVDFASTRTQKTRDHRHETFRAIR